MNAIVYPETDPDGQPLLLQRKDSRNLFGDFTVLDLKKYEIPMVAQDGNYLLPMQTLSAFLLSEGLKNHGLYFNGETVLFSGIQEMKDPGKQLYEMIIGAGLATPEIMQKVTAHGGTQAQKLELLFEEVSKASDTGAALWPQRLSFCLRYVRNIS